MEKLPAAAHPGLWKHLVVPRAQLIGTSSRQQRAPAQAGAERADYGLAWRPSIGRTGARAAAREKVAEERTKL